MSVPDLQRFIAEMRGWLANHAATCLEADHAPVLEEWRRELTGAEGLLEQKPELPIAFLGPSQQGKSSLINALLGETVLAVGGAVGACTCVITSVHYHPNPTFRAEIRFISFDEWKAELKEIQASISSKETADDTQADREDLDSIQRSALEKVRAVYLQEEIDDITPWIHDESLGLPSEVVHAMRTGEAIVIEVDSPIALRNTVRRYLVGREQHADAQFWPIIRDVRIFGKFDVLANGIVLVDLPGLNDPNPAREQITKRYLEDARYIWLVCNSQVGIDGVFSKLLRQEALLFRLFMEGRLDAFAVITTKVDDINIEAVLAQMNVAVEDFDGNIREPLAFRRNEIATYVGEHLSAIASDIAAKASHSDHREKFFDKVRKIPVFSVSTAAYLHGIQRMPLYRGMQMDREETHIPNLIGHLNSITLEVGYQQQVEASFRRLTLLHDQVTRFFFDLISRIEQDSQETRAEWETLREVAGKVIGEGRDALVSLRSGSGASLVERCDAFDSRLSELDARAGASLEAVFSSWQTINWRSLQAAVKRGGDWRSPSSGREFHFNRDIAHAYLDLLPFIWEDFFGNHLSELIEFTAKGSLTAIRHAAERLKGAMDMLQHQPDGLRKSMEASLRAAEESFTLQSGQVRSELVAQIQRTRQALSNGMVETAASFMDPAYKQAEQDPGGPGIKARMLAVLTGHAGQHAPSLFITMRRELTDGVGVLRGAMKPQLAKLIAFGDGILDRFQQNFGGLQVVAPELKEKIESALNDLPTLNAAPHAAR